MNPGSVIGEVLSNAERDVLIVAPFIQGGALSTLLEKIPSEVQKTIVTRWRPADVVSGVSDLAVYNIAEKAGAGLFLRYDLHAKLFCGDDKCVVGSANVSGAGLGWHAGHNLELVIAVPRSRNEVARFEKELMSGSVRATADQRDRLSALRETVGGSAIWRAEYGQEEDLAKVSVDWIPEVANPEELYSVYAGQEDVSSAVLRIMKDDLSKLGVIKGMKEPEFHSWIAASITQTAIVARVLEWIEREGEATESDMLNLLVGKGIDIEKYRPRDVLVVLERWLTYFLQERYETARDSVKLIRARRL